MAVQTWQYFRDLLINGYVPVGQDYTDLVDTIDSFDVSMVDNGDGTYTFTDSDGSFTINLTESQVSLEKEYNNIKKISTSFVNVGQLYIEHYSDGYIYAYNYDNDLDSNSDIFNLSVGDVLYVQGVDGETASLTVTDYVYSDSSLLEFEFGSLDSSDYLDSSGDIISYTDTNFSDSTGSVKFNVFLYSDTESLALNVADALSYLDGLESKLNYSFGNGVEESNGIVKQGGKVVDEIELEMNEGVGYKLTTNNQFENNIFTYLNNSNVFQMQRVSLVGNTNSTLYLSTFSSGQGYLGGQVYNGDAVSGTSYGSMIEATIPYIKLTKFNTPTGQSNNLILTDTEVKLNYGDIEIHLTNNTATVSTDLNQINDPKSIITLEKLQETVSGFTGSYLTENGTKTVNVVNGIITSVV